MATIKQAMEKKGLTRFDLAIRLGGRLSIDQLNRVLGGRSKSVDAGLVSAIAAEVDLSPEEVSADLAVQARKRFEALAQSLS